MKWVMVFRKLMNINLMVGVKMSDCQIKFHVNIYSHIQYHSNYIIINRAFYQHFQVKIVIAHQTITQILKAKSIS